MSNICKTVSLRTRKIKDGHMLSYYLDYYPGYRDESTMKVIRHDTARAEAIRCRRFEAIVNERYDFFDKEKNERRFPCLLQETGGQEELQVAARLYALSYIHARQVYLRGDKRGLVQQIS